MTTYEKNIMTKEYLEHIKDILERYQKIGFKLLNISDYYDLANYYLEKIYSSGLSLFDYSFYHYLPFPVNCNTSINKLLNAFKSIDETMYNEIISREDTTKEKALEIVQKIIDDNLDIIDYYSMTKLNPLFFNEAFAKYKRNHSINDLYKGLVTDTTTLEKQSKIVFITKDGIVTQDLKEEVFKDLEKMNMPITVGTYKALARRKKNQDKKTVL